jgi:PIN domain nuclease of toxin-antitoxin system
MKLLLDTHALLWWATRDSLLPLRVRRVLGDRRRDVFVSAASTWEIATKVRLGKLRWTPEAGTVSDYVLRQGFRPVAISLLHAEAAGVLRIAHRDPFDRMLIAQAQSEDMWLVSSETLFDSFGVRRFW